MRVSYADWSRTATRMLKTEPGRRFSTPHPTCLVSDERETGSRVAEDRPSSSRIGRPLDALIDRASQLLTDGRRVVISHERSHNDRSRVSWLGPLRASTTPSRPLLVGEI